VSWLQAKIRHLQHESFTYQIRVDNSTGVEQEVVFRIFMAPLKDETGRSFSLREQQLLMIELDKFVKTGEHLLLRIFASFDSPHNSVNPTFHI
jgi:Hemocyanin, ig-like domain